MSNRSRTSDKGVRDDPPSLWRLFFVYLFIGISGFGPTLAAETKKRIVHRHKWIREEDFLNGLALAQILPGATYVSLTAYIGYKIRGTSGAVISFLALLIPSFLIMLMLSHVYLTYGLLLQVSIFFEGLAVIVAALIAHAVIEIGKATITDGKGLFLALASAGLFFLYPSIFLLLFLGAIAGIIMYSGRIRTVEIGDNDRAEERFNKSFSWNKLLGLFTLLVFIFLFTHLEPILLQLFWVFFRMGAFLFGGGFAMIPFIAQEVVQNYHWLTQDQFMVGLALGQVTPGPISITATFIGYKVAALSGAIAATFGVFLPSLFLVILTAELHQKIRNNKWVKSAIQGIVVVFTGMIANVVINLARHSLTDAFSICFAASVFLLLRCSKLDTVLVVVFGSSIYWLIKVAF
ncbi:MAG: chromate transporter, chromate ion transporter family [Firmicutes bacterium]|nr:chromate transporter, chromate ion transporter family [Bacillota bacterium]